MKSLFTNKRLLYISAVIILFISICGVYLYSAVLKSAEEIIESNKSITQTAVSQLTNEAEQTLAPVWYEHLAGKDRITKAEERIVDSLLSEEISGVLNHFNRVEGGLYFFKLDEFLGYSFPTIEPPKPAFGPPPRSYNIIRDQVRATIQQDTVLTQLHKFDPAIFPLTTRPIYLDGELIGAAWARIHIERELATSQTIQSGTFFLTVGLILFGLSIAVYIVWLLKKRIDEIKLGLERMKHNPSYRLKERSGVLGFISHSINDMTDTQQREQKKRKKLERELFQKEKMASLGNLVAGTAHEINTPISIIKTRIQIWERKLEKLRETSASEPFISQDALQMVRAEIDRVSGLIKRLLFFSKPVSDQKSLVDINSVMEEQLIWLEKAFPDSQLDINTLFESGLPKIVGDKESIQQVVINLLKNAVQASEKDCILFIQTHYIPEDEEIEIRIRDFGKGVPASIKHQIFDPFFTTKDNGSGLGLSISGEIVKAHHGRIYFTEPKMSDYPFKPDNGQPAAGSGNKKGTVCVVRLPVKHMS